MTSESMNSSFQSQNGSSNTELPVSGHGHASDISSALSSSRISSWALNQRTLQSVPPPEDGLKIENAAISTFMRITNGIGTRLSSAAFAPGDSGDATSTIAQGGVLESLTKGLVDTSRNAVKAVQVKARHIVSQNKRRYQEGGFDLDMAYITENMIAMGFPAGDISSGLFGYFEGFYRNQMEEVINFFETHHKGRYKVYNLCSERLYDASLFEGKVASFPFEDHNCPPLHLIKSFCQSAYSWLKEDILNVVVVHCKAGMARTGLMICSLLLFLKFFPTAEEAISYYNQKRCVDGKGLILPSQIRYVKYFERILKQFSGENQTGRRCMLRGFRLHRCPHWIRPSITISNHNGILFSTKKHPKTKNLMPEDFWICAARKGIAVFAIPGDPGVTELAGDFKIHFHDRHGDFYCWLNTTMMDNRLILNAYDLDDFDKRKLPSPGFQVEIVMIDYDGIMQTRSLTPKFTPRTVARHTSRGEVSDIQEKDDDVFSNSEGEEIPSSSEGRGVAVSGSGSGSGFGAVGGKIGSLTQGTDQLMSRSKESTCTASGVSKKPNSMKPSMDLGSSVSNIRAIAADASVFSFGDDDEGYESD